MIRTTADRLREMMPPDGTDLRDVFGPDAPDFDTGGLVRDDATVNMLARNAEQSAQGPEGFRDIWADWLEPWESFRIYYDDVIERDDRVIILARLRGVTKRDRVEMEHEAAAVFYFEGDQAIRVDFSLDREDALSG